MMKSILYQIFQIKLLQSDTNDDTTLRLQQHFYKRCNTLWLQKMFLQLWNFCAIKENVENRHSNLQQQIFVILVLA
jgi:hypothetical protein